MRNGLKIEAEIGSKIELKIELSWIESWIIMKIEQVFLCNGNYLVTITDSQST